MSPDDGPQDDAVAEELLPVFDPELPPKVAERLSRFPDRLLPAEDKPARTEPRRTEPPSPAARTVTAILLLGLTAGLTAGVAWLASALMPLLVGLAALVLLLGVVVGFWKGGCWIGLASLFLTAALVTVGQWLGHDGVVVLLSVATALLGVLVTVGAVFGDGHDSRPEAHHDHYLVPADFDEDGRELLLRVQRTRRLVAEAADILGDAFDSEQADLLLGDQEWRIARVLRKQRVLAEDLDERVRDAVSETVRESMRPRFEALRAAREAVERRVAAVVDYGDKVRLATVRQREWEQIEEARGHDDAYGDLLVDATADLPGSDRLRAATDLEAIREVRDAGIREALEAGRWLAEAAGPPSPGAAEKTD